MNTIDRNQEAFSLELTDYGKKLFHKFAFKPKYYYFSDQGIMYNGKSSELQNSIFDRLKNDVKWDNISFIPVEIGSYNNCLQAPAWKLFFHSTSRKLDEIEYSSDGTTFARENQQNITCPLEKYFKQISANNFSLLTKKTGEIFIEERIPQFFINIKTKLFEDMHLHEAYFAEKDIDTLLEVIHENVADDEFEIEFYTNTIDEFQNIVPAKRSIETQQIFDFYFDEQAKAKIKMTKNVYGNPSIPDKGDKC